MNSSKSNKDIQILIVDDEEDIGFLLANLLKSRGLSNIRYVSSLEEASKVLETLKPSLVFLDNHLPDGRGVNYISFLKSAHPETKIVMITAHDTNQDKNIAISNGADAFIGKPFTRETIYQTVEKLTQVA